MNIPPGLRRVGWLAVGLVALAAYAFYYLSSVPQAWSAEDDSQGRWEANGEDQLQLLGPKAGPLLSSHVGCMGNLALRTGHGRPESIIAIAKGAGASVDVALAPDPGAGGGGSTAIILEAIRGDPDYPHIKLQAQNASLRVDAYAIPVPGSTTHVPVSFTTHQLDIVFPCRQSEDPEGLRLDLGDIEDVDAPPILHVQGVAIGQTDSDGVFDRTSMACGAKKGRKVWRLPVPSVEPADCRPGFLSASELRIDKSLSLTLGGSAFTVRDGKPHVWPMVDDIMNNPVLKYVIGAGIAGLVASVGLNLRQRTQARKRRDAPDDS